MFTRVNDIGPKYDFQSDAQTDIAIVRVVVVERAVSVNIAGIVGVASIRRNRIYPLFFTLLNF